MPAIGEQAMTKAAAIAPQPPPEVEPQAVWNRENEFLCNFIKLRSFNGFKIPEKTLETTRSWCQKSSLTFPEEI